MNATPNTKPAVSPKSDEPTAPAEIRPTAVRNPPNGTFNGLGVTDPNPQGGNSGGRTT